MIHLIQTADAKSLSNYYKRNADHFAPWEPARAAEHYSPASCAARIEQSGAGQSVYFVLRKEQQIIGHCELSQIVYGPFRACYMGYGLDSNYQGRGLALQLCQHVILYAFSELKLHRVMANYMPANTRSEKLLMRLGFEKEGLAKKYLKIAGQWQDHVLTSLINPDDIDRGECPR